jgi:hypothetical protein
MSTPINDGGPAFPVADVIHPNGQVQYGANGMALRDWFAGQALQSYLAGRNNDARDSNPAPVADVCYKYADAMLAARERASLK